MSEGALESIKDFGDYLFSEEGTYLRMYGGTKAPSLLPKYATDYIVRCEKTLLGWLWELFVRPEKGCFSTIIFLCGKL